MVDALALQVGKEPVVKLVSENECMQKYYGWKLLKNGMVQVHYASENVCAKI